MIEEDLNIEAMKRLWGRKVSDLAFAEFMSILEAKAGQRGKQIIKTGRGVCQREILCKLGDWDGFLLGKFASDSRWRVREAVAIALQRFGEVNMGGLLTEMMEWSEGSLLEKRAVVAAICEPRPLCQDDEVHRVMQVLDRITYDLQNYG